LLFISVDADRPRLAGADPSPRRRHVNESSCPHHTAFFCRRPATPLPSSNAEGALPFQSFYDCCLLVPMLIVLASLRLIQRHRPIYAENSANTSTGTVQFQYWASTGAHTGIGTAVMEFISSTGTCQVPVPVLALTRWSSFPVRALAKCLYRIGMAIRCPN
jgi:hypothetical protein